MGLHQGTCDKCGEMIEPKEQYAITRQGSILCLQCGQAKPDKVLAWRTAAPFEEEEQPQAEEPEKETPQEEDKRAPHRIDVNFQTHKKKETRK